jgi:hypothetical protein
VAGVYPGADLTKLRAGVEGAVVGLTTAAVWPGPSGPGTSPKLIGADRQLAGRERRVRDGLQKRCRSATDPAPTLAALPCGPRSVRGRAGCEPRAARESSRRRGRHESTPSVSRVALGQRRSVGAHHRAGAVGASVRRDAAHRSSLRTGRRARDLMSTRIGLLCTLVLTGRGSAVIAVGAGLTRSARGPFHVRGSTVRVSDPTQLPSLS